MHDKLLKAATEEDMKNALSSFALNGNGEWLDGSKYFSLLVIGKMHADDAAIDPETFEVITPPTLLDGFYANILCHDSIFSKIDPSVIIADEDLPANRQYKWAI